MLGVYRDEDVINKLWANGQAVIDAVETAAMLSGMDVSVVGYAPHFTLRFAEDHRRKMSVFCQRMAARGILWHPAVTNASAAMDVQDVVFTQQAVMESLADIAAGCELVGDVYAEGARVTP
jgi:glutamate-1-semialdehyde aminotransferase